MLSGPDHGEVPVPKENGQKLTERWWNDPGRTDADLRTIEDHPDIEALSLADSQVTDCGLRSLRE